MSQTRRLSTDEVVSLSASRSILTRPETQGALGRDETAALVNHTRPSGPLASGDQTTAEEFVTPSEPRAHTAEEVPQRSNTTSGPESVPAAFGPRQWLEKVTPTPLREPVLESGMSPAFSPNTMQASDKMNENTRPEEQNLPLAATGTELARPVGRTKRSGVRSLDGEDFGAARSVEMTLASRETVTNDVARTASDLPGARSEIAEKVLRTCERAVEGLRRTNESELSVVVRPDNATQLALHVKCHQGQIEAIAVLERGDFAALGAEWAQLQSRLAEHGVRLAPLAPGLDPGISFGGGGLSSKQQPQGEPNRPELPLPFTFKTQTQATAKPGARPGAGREWWA
jgi:hypothetical protein